MKVVTHIINNGVPFRDGNRAIAIDNALKETSNKSILSQTAQLQKKMTTDFLDMLTTYKTPLNNQIQIIKETFPPQLHTYLPDTYKEHIKKSDKQQAIKNFSPATLTTFGNRVPNQSNSRGVPYKN